MKDRMINKLSGYEKYKNGITRSRCYLKDEEGNWKEIYEAGNNSDTLVKLREGEHIVLYRNMYTIVVKAYDEEYDCFQFFLEKFELEGSRKYIYFKDE